MDSCKQLPATVECVWAAEAILGEGPCWDSRFNHLYWVDIKGRRLHRYSPENQIKKSWNLSYRLCSVDIPPPGWHPPKMLGDNILLGCGDLGFGWLSIKDNETEFCPIAHPEKNQPENRFNDGKIGLDGRYWAGTMHDSETKTTGTLYAFDSDGGAMALDHGYRVPNGPAFGRDGRTVYHTDSASQIVYAFDLNPGGQLENKREFVRFGPDEGYPDGMIVDCEDNVWVALWDGGRIEKISPNGERLGQIALPVHRPTSCIFSDPGCKQLYVTSAGIGAAPDDALAGGLFLIGLPSPDIA